MDRFNRNRGGGRGFGGGYGGGNRWGGGGRRENVMYDAVCSNCGNDCQVPFRPTGAKPVLCDNCFRANGAEGHERNNDRGGDRFERRAPQGGRDNGSGKQLQELSTKVDKLIAMVEKLSKSQGGVQKEHKKEVAKAPKIEKETKIPVEEATDEISIDELVKPQEENTQE